MHDEIHYESESKEKEKYGLIKTIIAIIIMKEADSVIDIGFLLFLASSIRCVTCLILKHSLIIPPTKETKAYKQSESVCVCVYRLSSVLALHGTVIAHCAAVQQRITAQHRIYT